MKIRREWVGSFLVLSVLVGWQITPGSGIGARSNAVERLQQTVLAHRLPVSADAQAASIRARPLFSPGRLPESSQTAPEPVATLPKLFGIISTPTRTVAFFEAEGERQYASAPVGAFVSGWTVDHIAKTMVTLKRADEYQIVRLQTRSPENTEQVEQMAPTGLLATRKADPHLQP